MGTRNRWVPARAPRKAAAKLGRRRLAEKYVAVIRGRKFGAPRASTYTVFGTDKRETMRQGKATAWDLRPGTVVTLRAHSKRGAIVERVVMEATTNGIGYRWRQAFET
jgi:hypothetical protein